MCMPSAFKKVSSFFHQTPLNEKFREALEGMLSVISQKPNLSAYKETLTSYVTHAQTLYQLLLAPVLHQMKEKPQELCIIPDEQLSKLPFEALVCKYSEDTEGFDDLHYLLYDHKVTYALSSRLLKRSPARKTAPKRLLGFGYTGRKLSTSLPYRALPGSVDEINFLKKNFAGDFHLGETGSKKSFLESAQDYDVLHLAIHGESDNEDRYGSKLIFDGEDSVLKTSDLYVANLNARLAVLSACESGVGEISKGEGTFSIARGFALTGVPSIVMSLWKVNDRIASQLMVDLHKNLSDEKSVGLSLSDAKRSFLEDADQYTSHPYYWSSFVSLGDDLVIDGERKGYQWLAITLLSAFVLTVGVVGYKKRFFSRGN